MEQRVLDDKETVIILDTNILLDLGRTQYYFSNKCLEILKALESRLWISNQVKVEFEKNKDEVFNGEIKRYRKIRKNLNELVNNLEKRILENILSEYYEKNFTGLANLRKDISNQVTLMKNHIQNYNGDGEEDRLQQNSETLKNGISEFLSNLENQGKIGEKFNFEEKLKILIEGEVRYKYKIPPGFEDSNKNNEDKFGDLFIWKEILNYTENNDEVKKIVFVTNDAKSDWLENKNPHPMLIEEFKSYFPTKELCIMGGVEFYSQAIRELPNFDNSFDLDLYINLTLDLEEIMINKVKEYLRKIYKAKLFDKDSFLNIDSQIEYNRIVEEKRKSGQVILEYEAQVKSILDFVHIEEAVIDGKEYINASQYDYDYEEVFVKFTRSLKYKDNFTVLEDKLDSWQFYI